MDMDIMYVNDVHTHSTCNHCHAQPIHVCMYYALAGQAVLVQFCSCHDHCRSQINECMRRYRCRICSHMPLVPVRHVHNDCSTSHKFECMHVIEIVAI